MISQDLSPEQEDAVRKAEKLFRLAGKNTNQNEAASAISKGMELLAAHNLDMSILEQGGGEKSKRSDEKMVGGLYHYQRELWTQIAALNFCMYWNQYNYDPNKVNRYRTRQYKQKVMGGYVFQHRLVGRVVNIVATQNMADYLESTIERLTKERLMDRASRLTTRIEALWGEWAVQFRTGIADEIITKLYNRRQEFLREEAVAAHKVQEDAARAAASGVSMSTALVMASLAQSERDANMDHLYGEGFSARNRAKRAEQAAKAQAAEEAYTKWAAANPEEAAKEAEEDRKRQKKEPWNKGMGGDRDHRKYTSAYYSGREVGKDVSIDPQMDDAKAQRKIGRG